MKQSQYVAAWTIALMLAGGGAVAQPDAPPAGSAEARINLTGNWLLDESASDNPVVVMREASMDSGNSGGKLKRVLGGVSVFGVPVGSLPLPDGTSSQEPPDPDEAAGPAAHTLEVVREIRILQQDDATELDYDGRVLASYPHGVPVEANDATVEAGWERQDFVIEHELDDGTKIRETYRLDEVRRELIWTVRFKAKKADAIEIERTYYAEKPAGAELTAAH